MKKILITVAVLGLAVAPMTGCEEKSSTQKVADATKDAAKKTGEAAKEGAAKVGEAAKDATK